MDTTKAYRHLPLFHFKDIADFQAHVPRDCSVVGVEYPGKRQLGNFCHPERTVYLLGAEDKGLSKKAKAACESLVEIPTQTCLNVAAAGAIVMYDRTCGRPVTRNP
jgi:tRNA G18 (ribose-2'-O)-methylase SpoU